jgi:Ca-activated chloride channel family protein
MLTANRVRTSLAIGAAGAAVVAAWLLVPGPAPISPTHADASALPASDDGLTLEARMQASAMIRGAHDEDVVLDIHAQARDAQERPPLTLAVVIDRSGSMDGPPLANAKAAALKLVDDLAPSDTFSIVTFSTSSEVVAPMAQATSANKARARDAIMRIEDTGGTCTSCGLDQAVSELGHAATSAGGVHRIVLISDGHANEGIWDKTELVAMASRIAQSTASITTVGVGLDFDEVTMTRIAEVGRGNYYFVEDTANLGAMFERELGGLAATVATDVHVVLPDVPGASAIDAIGYPATRLGSSLVIPVSDVRAGESRKVVVRVHVAAGVDSRIVAEPQLAWRGVGVAAGLRHAYARLEATTSDDPAAIAAATDHLAVQAVEQARSAQALEEVTQVYEKQGYQAAEQVMQQRVTAMHARAAAIGDAQAMDKLDAANGEAMQMMKSMAPAKATKAVRVKSYELAR